MSAAADLAPRRRGALAALVAAVAVFALSALAVRPDRVALVEQLAFHAVNDVAWLSTAPVWVVMQLGNLLAIPVVAAAAAFARRSVLAVRLACSGALAYLLAPVVKDLLERGRPAALLSDVVVRDVSEGFGFVSGHTAVAVALAVAALPFLPARGRALVLTLAGAVALARVYVGVHLPLDVIGGAALGAIVAIGVALLSDLVQVGWAVSPSRTALVEAPVPPTSGSLRWAAGLRRRQSR